MKEEENFNDHEIDSEFLIPDEDYFYLYQCYLALQSENKERIEKALDNIPKILVQGRFEINPDHIPNMLNTLFRLRNSYKIEKFTSRRNKCMTFLVLSFPKEFSTSFTKRFFSSECSTGEKITLLGILDATLLEIFNNATNRSQVRNIVKKLQRIDNNDKDKEESWLTVVDSSIKTKELNQSHIDKRIEKNTRRWGYALHKPVPIISKTNLIDELIEIMKPVYYMIFLYFLDYAKKNPKFFENQDLLLVSFIKLLRTFIITSSKNILFIF